MEWIPLGFISFHHFFIIKTKPYSISFHQSKHNLTLMQSSKTLKCHRYLDFENNPTSLQQFHFHLLEFKSPPQWLHMYIQFFQDNPSWAFKGIRFWAGLFSYLLRPRMQLHEHQARHDQKGRDLWTMLHPIPQLLQYCMRHQDLLELLTQQHSVENGSTQSHNQVFGMVLNL